MWKNVTGSGVFHGDGLINQVRFQSWNTHEIKKEQSNHHTIIKCNIKSNIYIYIFIFIL